MDLQELKVTLWGREVGTLQWLGERNVARFHYNPTFLQSGLDIAPLTASIYHRDGTVDGCFLSRHNKFTGLPVFIADSLPDTWGKRLLSLWAGRDRATGHKLTSLQALSWLGNRAMGALEYVPDTSPWHCDVEVNLSHMALMATSIVGGMDSYIPSPAERQDFSTLCSIGTLAGGMQPKALIAMNDRTGEVRSGQMIHQGDWKYYILKFSNAVQFQQAEMEMGYYRMAGEAGIDMMPSRLLQIDGQNHFLTERFDRAEGVKMHLQTLGAMNPTADSYEDIMLVCDELQLPYADKEQMYRRMVFNVLAGNTDDHNRNFSFMMTPDGRWHITPAYDLTFTVTIEHGIPEGEEHELSVRGKSSGITDDDFLLFAKENDIKNASRIIREVRDAVSNVYVHLTAQGVDPAYAEAVAEYLTGNGVFR